ncbi:hypothetical protein [Nocardioides convexus]|uniref:hypothetical protein n=1 Tax=Nocardioides convexus TaxID=2712224 RepID=UPI002418BB89|nr:hypothetical protein [Nocardioides convexus]
MTRTGARLDGEAAGEAFDGGVRRDVRRCVAGRPHARRPGHQHDRGVRAEPCRARPSRRGTGPRTSTRKAWPPLPGSGSAIGPVT